MRRYLRIPQIAAVMGQCIAGGAYLPALSDVILMVKGTSFMGLGGPNLVKGATGADDRRGDARRRDHAHGDQRRGALRRGRMTRSACGRFATWWGAWRPPSLTAVTITLRRTAPATDPAALYDLLPNDHRMSYDMHAMLGCIVDAGSLDEFQPNLARRK